MANKGNMGGPWGKAESDLPGDTPVDPIAPASIPEPAPIAEPDGSRASFASAAAQFGRDYLRKIYPEFYSGDRAKAQSSGDGGSSEALRADMATIQKAMDESDKRDQQYRRDVNDLKTRLTATDAILKNNTDLLRQEVMLQTRTIAILHELVQAQKQTSDTGIIGAATEILGGISFLKSFLPGQLAVAVSIVMNLKQTMDQFTSDYEKYSKEYQEGRLKPDASPGFSERAPDPRDSLPENQFHDNLDPRPEIQRESFITGGSSQDENVIKLKKLEFDADTLTFESEKFTFKHSSGESSSHYSGMNAGQYGQAASGIQMAAYHPDGGIIPQQGPSVPGATIPKTNGGGGLGSILGALGGGGIGSLLGGLGGGDGKGFDLSSLASSPLGQSLMSNPTIAKMVAPYVAKQAAAAIPDSISGIFGGGDKKPGANGMTGAMGITPEQFNAFKEGVAQVEHADYGQMGGAGHRFAGRYQMGQQEIAETAKRLGEDVPSTQSFLKDPAMQDRYFENYSLDHYNTLSKNPKFAEMSKEQQLEMMGYAHNQGAGGANKYMNSGQVVRDAFGTAGTAYFGPIHDRLGKIKESPATSAPAISEAKEGWGAKAYDWLANSPLNSAKPHQPSRPITATPRVTPPAIGKSSSSELDADKKKIVPDSYGKPEGVNPSSSVHKPADIQARAPGLNVNYYSHLYPHLYGKDAQYSPETQARTA